MALGPLARDAAVWWLTGTGPQRWRRGAREIARLLSGGGHRVWFYHRVADPHSLVLGRLLPRLARAYRVEIVPRIMLDVPIEIDPDPKPRRAYLTYDAQRLGAAWNVAMPEPCRFPSEPLVLLANRILFANIGAPDILDLANDVTAAAWRADKTGLAAFARQRGTVSSDRALTMAANNQAEQRRRGHYLGGMLFYGGEWYWGADRLGHLTDRLGALGIAYGDGRDGPDFDPARWQPARGRARRTLEFFFSFRSPYSYLAVSRVFDFVARHDIDLVFRPLLPMVQRGLPVPDIKLRYIVADAAREARRHSVPFGRIRDPLGTGVERCLALVRPASEAGLLREWLDSAGRAVFAEGIDLADDRRFADVVTRAGLDAGQIDRWLKDQSWRAVAASNEAKLDELRLWGVPSFHLHDDSGKIGVAAWGQDRFWALERAAET